MTLLLRASGSRRISKVQIVMLAFALFEGFAGNIFWGTLANATAARATKTIIITGSPTNNTNNTKPSKPTSNGSVVVRFENGSYGLIKPVNGTVTIPANATAFETSYIGLVLEASSGGSVRTEIVIISSYWFFLENLFDTMRSIRDQLSLLLFGVAFMLELPKKSKSPKLPVLHIL